MPPFWYRALLAVLAPLYRLRLWRRSGTEPDYALEVQQRFGPFVGAPLVQPVWVHAVSVGESHAAEPVIRHLLAQGLPVLVSNTTRTGRARIQQLFAAELTQGRVQSVFLPVDRPAVMQGFFDHHQPRQILLMETELWPTLLAVAQARQVPVLLLNARLSERSAQGYARVPSLTQPMLRALTAIAAQDADTAGRFAALGAVRERVQLTGSLKFDLTPPQGLSAQVDMLRVQWPLQDRRLLVAGSTHAPEEKQLLNIFKKLHAEHPETVLVLVPRHPERFDDVAALITEKGWPLARRSQGQAIGADTPVYLADSMGELWLWYALADMAFVGGSLAPVGGHNPLEPARLGVPVVVGPHTHNFALIVAALAQAGALQQGPTVADVYVAWTQWLEDEPARQQASQAVRALMERSQGALARQLALVDAAR